MCGVRGTASGRRHNESKRGMAPQAQCWEGGGGAALLPQIPRPSALLITRQSLSHRRVSVMSCLLCFCYAAAAAAAAAAPNVNTGSVSSANTVSSCTETDTTPPETLPCAPDVTGALPQVQSRAVSSESSHVPEAVADASDDSSAHQGRPKVMGMS